MAQELSGYFNRRPKCGFRSRIRRYDCSTNSMPRRWLVGKWLCVVVKYAAEDAFMVTAYLTDQLKAGETIWPQK